MEPNQESANCLAELSPTWTGDVLPTGADVFVLSNGRISTSFFLDDAVTEVAILAIDRLELSVAAGAPRLDTALWP